MNPSPCPELPLLQVNQLTVELALHQTVEVVRNLSFNLYPGHTLTIVGESGCGKSMTALSLLRLLPLPPALPPKGEVLYRGENLLTLPEKKLRKLRGAQIGIVFQDPSGALNPVYTIGEQLIEVGQVHLNLEKEESWSRAVRALSEVGISSPEKRMGNYPHQLSGGMLQRVMIAMALLGEPEILIADEPTTALDVTIQAQVLALLRDLQERKGMALLLITHDMGVVAEMAHEVVVMYASEALEKGTIDDIFDERAHPYTQALFASRPTSIRGLSSSKKSIQPIPGNVPLLGHMPTGCRFHPRCPYVQEKCKTNSPPMFQAKGSPRHDCRCFLLETGAMK